jgi:hypothetical protein
MPNLAGVLEATCHCPAARLRHQTRKRAHQTTEPSTSDASGTHDRFSRCHHGASNAPLRLARIMLKNFRAMATRFDNHAYIFHGTVIVASIRLRS